MNIIQRYTGDILLEWGTDSLTQADLRGADLRGADLRGAYLRKADLSWANLREANLHGANLHGAHLRGANLRGAYLRGADLSWTDLSWADLRKANLYGADLSEADLRGVDLSEANVEGATYGEGIPLGHPQTIAELEYPVMVMSEHMKIGCKLHSFDAWFAFSDKDILEMGGQRALKFWRRHKSMLQAKCYSRSASPDSR